MNIRACGSDRRSWHSTRICWANVPKGGPGAPDAMGSGASLNWFGSSGWLVFIAAAAVSFGLLLLLRPVLKRHALAQPNARSSLEAPTPQGCGFGVIAATIGIVIAAALRRRFYMRRAGVRLRERVALEK